MDQRLLAERLTAMKQPNYRLKQAVRAYAVDFLSGWDEVTTFPKQLRDQCKEEIPWESLTPARTQESEKRETVKTLFTCSDGKTIEAVLMRHEDGRNTVCLSCQVGCPMACTFCATGTMGLKRQLTAEEMVEQVIWFARFLVPLKERITNIVFMGMGEPMHNYDEVMRAIRILHDPDGFNLGARHFTISTCGIVPGILKLAEEDLQVNLAISLHSAVDATRTSIMPVNRAYPLKALMEAVDVYTEKTNRKVFFEYLLLKGINDTEKEAEALEKLLGYNRRLFHVNLIKYHDTAMFTATPKEQRFAFMEWLQERGMPVTHRVTFGEDIDAACGQLAINDADDLMQGVDAARKNRQKKSAKV